jgi:hypothetical protein
MKQMNLKLALAAICFMLVFASCEKEIETPEPESTELSGELSENKTLESGKTYTLSGGYNVKSGAKLTIESGVTIIAKDDDIVDYILIEQGAKIDARGTATNPIVMTSEKKEAGAWGGLHVCGYAPINVTGATSKSEIGDAVYGGDKANDNSGVLRYIRIEYAGYAFSEEKEANGFTFYGVGNGTTAEYLQSYKGSDDGFEWFGGTVNLKYLVSTDNSDDSFDWTEGWSGKGQFWIAFQTVSTSLGYDCDCLIEADNNSKDFSASPVSSPVLSNLTLVGNGSADNKRGIRLRAGTNVSIYNVLVKGKPSCLTTETVETENSLVSGSSILDYIYIESEISCKEGIYSKGLFEQSGNNKTSQTISFTNNYFGTISAGKDVSAIDGFFTKATYKGAVSENNDWTKGWIK